MNEALVKHLKVTRWLQEYSASIHPVLGEPIKSMGGVPIDLSSENSAIQPAGKSHVNDLQAAVDTLVSAQGGVLGYGGYAENRNFYASSPLFNNAESNRTIHLGIDVWLPAGSPIYAPLAGEIYGCQINNEPLDYGGTIITKHTILGVSFYLLFGHLSYESVEQVQVNQLVDPKQHIGVLGAPSENGGWPPHLHLQMIIDLEDRRHDYPGLCSLESATKYLYNCPDPFLFLQPPT